MISASSVMLETLLGKLGLQLHEYANGLDGSPVRPAGQQEPVKSVGNGTTFPKNLTRWEEVQRGLAVLSDSVAMRLRQQGLYCGGVSVSPAERPVPHRVPANAAPGPHPLDEGYLAGGHGADPAAVEGPGAGTDAHRHRPVYHRQRRLLPAAGSVEAPVVTQQQEKQEKLERTMDAIRGKYGRASISFGLPGEERAGWDD